MKKIKITKEQHELAIKEAVSLTVNTGSTNGNVDLAIQNTKRDAQKSGINPNKVGFNIPAQESVIVTKKDIKEMRIKNLLKNAKTISKKELTEKIIKLNEDSKPIMCSELENSGITKLRDRIIECKNEFKASIDAFFNALIQQGHDMKSINKIIEMYQLGGYIPKAEINRKESEFKNSQKLNKQNIKDQTEKA